MVMNFEDIKKVLLHRFPFLMVDRVIEIEKGKRIVAIKNVTGNEIHFLGHFPEVAIMPGVLIIEAMAQTGALLLMCSTDSPISYDEIRPYLVGVDKVRITSPVVPGDQMRIEVESIKLISYAGIVQAEVKVSDKLVAKGQITFGGKV